jgi:MFS family permease
MMDQSKTQWANIFFLCATGVLVALHIYKLAPALPAMRVDLGLDLVTGGQLFSIINLVGMLFGVFAGGIADSFGHKRVIVWALILVTLTSFATSLVDNHNLILLLRLLEGVGFVAVTASAPSLIAGQATEQSRRMAMGVWGAYMPAGSVISMLVAPVVLEHVGWRGLWQVAALISFILLLLMLFWIGPQIKEHREAHSNRRVI